jgi:hypothetical protein
MSHRAQPYPKHVITLANGMKIPIHAYVEGIKKAKENPAATFSHGLTTWWQTTGREIMEQFREMVTDHCNRGIHVSAKTRQDAISRAWRKGRPSPCKWCGSTFIRRNPFNDMDSFCSDSCRRTCQA